MSATTTGAEYIAVFVYDCETVAEQQSVTKTLSASGGIKDVDLTASLAHTLPSAQSSNNVLSTITGQYYTSNAHAEFESTNRY